MNDELEQLTHRFYILELRCLALRNMLTVAREAIAFMPVDMLGTVVAPDGSYCWPIRDELLTRIDEVLEKTEPSL